MRASVFCAELSFFFVLSSRAFKALRVREKKKSERRRRLEGPRG